MIMAIMIEPIRILTDTARAMLLLSLTCAAFFTFACRSSAKGTIRVIDPAYTAVVIATNEDGFDAPDGLLWRDGKIYMADEGGASFRIWSGPNQSETISDARSGLDSPEDFSIDSFGNVYLTDDDVAG